MTLTNPIFSFVQFTSGDRSAECGYALPIVKETDLKFQLHIDLVSFADMLDFIAADHKLFIVKPDAIITDEASLTANTMFPNPYIFDAIALSDTSVVLCWDDGLPGVETLDPQQCFRLCAIIIGEDGPEYFISNCFYKESDERYTSVLEYYCEEDAYDFDYCAGCANRIRLPLFITRPQFKDDETVYVRSDGSRDMLKSITNKSFEGKTDYLPGSIHEKTKMALSHDSVMIESYHYTGGISKDGDYSISWIDFMDEEFAQASFKVFATPYLAVNNNCEVCEPYVVPVLCASVGSVEGVTSKTPVACAGVNSVNGITVVEPLLCAEVTGASGYVEVEIECREYYNNTGNPLTDVDYKDCDGGDHYHETVVDGQSICARPSPGGTDGGYLNDIGTC